MPSETEIAEVAGKLTEAQRAWLMATEPSLDKEPREPCAEWWDGPSLYVVIDGEDHWLGSKGMTSPEGSPVFTEGWQSLNSLGLAVRTYLQARNEGGDGG